MMMGLICIWMVVLVLRVVLRLLNMRHLESHGGEVPREFAEWIDAGTLRRAAEYAVAQNRLGFCEFLSGQILLAGFLFSGGLAACDRWLAGWAPGFTLQGVLFFLALALAEGMLSIPFSLYRQFRLEKRFGFSNMTWQLWLADQLKGLLLSTLILGVLLAGAFTLVALSPDWWWFWVWGLFALMTLVLMYLSPVLIEPWFFKFAPVTRDGLEEAIRRLIARAGIPVSRILQVDASRRSRHSNAYFTGVGRVKRIVLFDTLLEQMNNPEILAVLAHEAGHWKKKHVFKRLLASQALALVACWGAFVLLEAGHLGRLVGEMELSFFAELLLLLVCGSLLGMFLTPLSSWLSRRHEWQADRYAVELLKGESAALVSALAKLARENLANLHPHPIYAWFYYSHPPLVQRVGRLQDLSATAT